VADDTTILDAEQIVMLRELDAGDGTFLPTIADEYERGANTQIDMMGQALAADDAHTLQRAAHGLKGASANLGAAAMTELCRALETAGREGSLDVADLLIEAIRLELERVHGALRQVVVGV
jgi:hypothetical protein